MSVTKQLKWGGAPSCIKITLLTIQVKFAVSVDKYVDRVASDYELGGPGSNPGGDEIFRPSIPALGPTQLPVQWVPGLSRGLRWPGRGADPPPSSSAEVLKRVHL